MAAYPPNKHHELRYFLRTRARDITIPASYFCNVEQAFLFLYKMLQTLRNVYIHEKFMSKENVVKLFSLFMDYVDKGM